MYTIYIYIHIYIYIYTDISPKFFHDFQMDKIFRGSLTGGLAVQTGAGKHLRHGWPGLLLCGRLRGFYGALDFVKMALQLGERSENTGTLMISIGTWAKKNGVKPHWSVNSVGWVSTSSNSPYFEFEVDNLDTKWIACNMSGHFPLTSNTS